MATDSARNLNVELHRLLDDMRPLVEELALPAKLVDVSLVAGLNRVPWWNRRSRRTRVRASAGRDRALRPRLVAMLNFARRHRWGWPGSGIVIVTLIAYHFTLVSLFDFLRFDATLAYLPLLPLCALGLAIVTVRRHANAKPPIRDRHVDLLVGIPLLIAALLLITLVPVVASTYYWAGRGDVLSLALFTAGTTAIAYGVTWLWRLKASFVFLLLMWPALYLQLLSGVLQAFTNWVDAALSSVALHLPLGMQAQDYAGTIVLRPSHGAALHVPVATVSPTVNTMLGFALIGSAILTTMRGGFGRKLLWLVNGLAVAFVSNVIRLTLILALAAFGQTGPAQGAYHVIISPILLALTAAIMVLALPYFGLQLKQPVTGAAPRTDAIPLPAPAKAGGRWQHARRLTKRRVIGSIVVVLLTGALALIDGGLQPYAAFGNVSGSATVQAFNKTASVPGGWRVTPTANWLFATEYFGTGSTWVRYRVVPARTKTALYADVVLTLNKASLDTYNVVNSVLFRNYAIRTWQRIDLGDGVYGLVLNYSDPITHRMWASVSWVWPVLNNGVTFYERIVLTSPSVTGAGRAAGAQLAGGVHDVFLTLLNDVSGGRSDPSIQAVYHNTDAALEATAEILVRQAVQTRS